MGSSRSSRVSRIFPIEHEPRTAARGYRASLGFLGGELHIFAAKRINAVYNAHVIATVSFFGEDVEEIEGERVHVERAEI